MLKIENLHKIYGKYHALSGLNMTVKEGALYGFVGPNGAGKTTAIKIMTGLLEAEEGSVIINGEDALAAFLHRLCTGFLWCIRQSDCGGVYEFFCFLLSYGRTGGKKALYGFIRPGRTGR